jgi:hypothetical protein
VYAFSQSLSLTRSLSLSRARALSLSPPPSHTHTHPSLSLCRARSLSLARSRSRFLTRRRARLACCSSVSIVASAHQRIETSILGQPAARGNRLTTRTLVNSLARARSLSLFLRLQVPLPALNPVAGSSSASAGVTTAGRNPQFSQVPLHCKGTRTLTFENFCAASRPPYLAVESLQVGGSGSASMKSRSNIQRRGHANAN